MRPPGRLIRRAVIDPLWVPVAVVIAGLLVLVAAAGVVLAPLASRRRLPRLAIFAAVYVLTDAALVVACACLFLSRPGQQLSGDRSMATHAALLRRALRVLVRAAVPLLGFGTDVEEMPAPDSLAGHPVLVLARHAGPGDSVAIVELLITRLDRRPVIVLKETLRWDPGLDIVLTRMRACFVPGRESRRDVPDSIAAAARGLGDQDAFLLFPEGGNWTPGRHRKALARLRTSGRRAEAARAAANQHVLPPQPAGVLACLEARPDLQVIVVAHTGMEDLFSATDIWRALPLNGRSMTMRWWKLPRTQLPADADGRRDWLELQWSVVDSWIDARKSASLDDAVRGMSSGTK
jgi:1-acyl-sn-glycerol-3-phosphate acyltransferase